MTPLDEGFRGSVFLDAGGTALSIGRTAESFSAYQLEARLLPFLRDRLPLVVPEPMALFEPSVRFPFGALRYRHIPGRVPTPEDLSDSHAQSAARFLAALHSLVPPPGLVPDTGSQWRRVREVFSITMPYLRAHASDLHAALEQWSSCFLDDPELNAAKPALIHGDFWHGNWMIDESSGELATVLDFESSCLGDPARDLATILHAGPEFAERAVRHYSALVAPDASFTHRIAQWWRYREFTGLALALTHAALAREIPESLGKIRRSQKYSP